MDLPDRGWSKARFAEVTDPPCDVGVRDGPQWPTPPGRHDVRMDDSLVNADAWTASGD